MFISDRDLLILEPNLFRDVAWIGQRLSRGSGTISGTTLTLSGAEVALDAAGVAAGHVATVGGVSYEITARLSATQATVSRVRGLLTDAAIPPTAVSAVETTIVTYKPQMEMAHRQVLRMLGIEPDGGGPEGQPGESSITNPAALKRLEMLAALQLIFAAAGALLGPDAEANQRAELYRLRFVEERARAVAYVDTDGDGRADVSRRPSVGWMVRG